MIAGAAGAGASQGRAPKEQATCSARCRWSPTSPRPRRCARPRATTFPPGRVAPVERLADAVPEVPTYFEELALNRARDNTMRKEQGAVPTEEFEVDLSDVVPI